MGICISRKIPHFVSVMSPVIRTPLTSPDKMEKNGENVPIDDILLGRKRKRKDESESEEEDSSEENLKKEAIRNVKRITVRVIRDDKKIIKKEKNDESDPDSEEENVENHPIYEEDNVDDDPDYGKDNKKDHSNYRTRNRKVIVPKTEGDSQFINKSDLSAYERMIEQKRAERMAWLNSMGINEIKADISVTVDQMKKKTPVKSYKIKSSPKTPKTLEPTRRSKRLANVDINLSEESLQERAVMYPDEPKEEPIPTELSFKDALKSENSYEDCCKDFNIQGVIPDQKFVSYDKAALNNMSLPDSNVCKVVPARITSVAWYPSAQHLIVSAGDKYGNFGLWNLTDSKSDPYLFKCHSGGISHMVFNPTNPAHLITSSYDATLRCCDLEKHMFNEVYDLSHISRLTYFDILHPTTYLISLGSGDVALVDTRTEKKMKEKLHTIHDRPVKTVNMHPVNKNVFVSADNRGSVRLWDLRKLQETPVVEITHHKRTVNSAFFSPVTGNSILTTSLDDTICIFDSTNLTSDIKLKGMMKHNNCTGRWLSIFRATWLPNSDDIFAVGSMDLQPRAIQIFDKNLFSYYNFRDDNLTTITSRHAFHPCRTALAAANSSGKLFVFT